jgi:hypothetical protein
MKKLAMWLAGWLCLAVVANAQLGGGWHNPAMDGPLARAAYASNLLEQVQLDAADSTNVAQQAQIDAGISTNVAQQAQLDAADTTNVAQQTQIDNQLGSNTLFLPLTGGTMNPGEVVFYGSDSVPMAVFSNSVAGESSPTLRFDIEADGNENHWDILEKYDGSVNGRLLLVYKGQATTGATSTFDAVTQTFSIPVDWSFQGSGSGISNLSWNETWNDAFPSNDPAFFMPGWKYCERNTWVTNAEEWHLGDNVVWGFGQTIGKDLQNITTNLDSIDNAQTLATPNVTACGFMISAGEYAGPFFLTNGMSTNFFLSTHGAQ